MAFPFQRSRRNRRRDEGFTLFTDTGSGADSRPRRGGVGRFVRTLVLLGVLVALSVGLADLAREHWLNHIESLAVKHIVVQRDGVLTEDEIRRLAGVSPGRNILTIDLFALRQRLRRHPRIEDARTRIWIPDTLSIVVHERTPVARVLLPPVGGVQAFYLLDETGHVLMPFEEGHAPREIIESEAGLPMITHGSLNGFASGQAVSDPLLLAALQFLAAYDSTQMAGVSEIVSVDVGTPGVLGVLSNYGARVTLAPEDFERQMAEWRAVHDRAASLNRLIGTLDLSVRANPPLKWLEASAPVPDSLPKTVRPKRKPLRRHV
jgi:hypothetical protein